MRHRWVTLFVASLGLTLASTSAWAQATGQISGTVRDVTNALLPGVEITVAQTDTGATRSTLSNEIGRYTLAALPVGPYRLEASLPGFQTYVRTGILLQVDGTPVVNVLLEVGALTQTVEVQADAALVETRTTSVGAVMDTQRILELPLNGRQVTDLITASGGAVQVDTATGPGAFQGAYSAQISVAGGLSFGVSYALDGAMHSDMYNGGNHPMPFPDALQEFKVETSGASASSSGMRSGGAVNAVTRSGTNQFHGSLFEFVRNYKLNGRNSYQPTRDTLKRNQFGGTIGGPIARDKVFFFGGFQGTRTRSDPASETSFVPTAAMLNGDFSQCSDWGSLSFVRNGVDVFNNSIVDPSEFSPAAVAATGFLPPAEDECGEVNWGDIEKLNEEQYVGKVDYRLNNNHTMFGRYLATAYFLPAAIDLTGNPLNSTHRGRDLLAQSYALGSTYLISPETVNSFRLTVNRTAHHRFHGDNFSVEDIGVDSYTSWGTASGRRRIDLDVADAFELGDNAEAQFTTTAYQLSDDVNLVRGSHQITFGATAAHWRTTQYAATRAVGQYLFEDASGLGLADFLLGNLERMEHGSDTAWASRNDYFAAYISDVWQATPNLTLNYGVRWEPYFAIEQTLGVPYHFDEEGFQQGIRSTAYPQAPAGLYFPGDPGFPDTGGPMEDKWGVFNPRFGWAWDVFGDGRTSIRSSVGMASDFTVAYLFGGGASAPPWGFRTEVSNPSGGFDNPWSDWVGPRPVPYTFGSGIFGPFGTFAAFKDYDQAQPLSQQWNLSVQQQLGTEWIASASYIGSRTIHTWANLARNNAVYFPGDFDANGNCMVPGFTLSGGTPGDTCSTSNNTNDRRRLNLQNPVDGALYGVVNTREDGGWSEYNGMLLSIQRRPVSGVSVNANYTWSHCIGLLSIFDTNEDGAYLDPNDRDFDLGNCDSDRRHVFNVTGVVATPEFANNTLRMIASGWQLSGLVRAATGSYIEIQNRRDSALIGDARNGVQRPNQLLQDVYLEDTDCGTRCTQWLDPNAFARPSTGTFGNMRPGTIQNPGTWGLDLALSRTFNLTETQRLEFRGEAFNATNSTRLGPLGDSRGNRMGSRLGQIRTALDARIMQFALKYVF